MRLWISRILIGLVLLDNLQAAVLFISAPDGFPKAFDLAGPAGSVATRSIGILFLMWCVPYIFAMVHPIRYRISLIEACLMQGIGLVGESILIMNLPVGLVNTPASLQRFIIFDAVGLILLLIAFGLTVSIRPLRETRAPRT
jgi:hypothetical protein